MLIYLQQKLAIKQAQSKLERTIGKEFSRKSIKDIGYPGGRVRKADILTNGRYWFRSSDLTARDTATPRRLNWFGRYGERPGTGIIVEINVAYEGRDGQAAGFFAQDSETRTVYLMHSGRVGGGTKGVGKNSFRAWSGEPLIEVFDSEGSPRHGLIVMPIEGKAANRSALRYIQTVEQFKKAVKNGFRHPNFKENKSSMGISIRKAAGVGEADELAKSIMFPGMEKSSMRYLNGGN